jgi:hypothetical protein
MQIDTTSLDYHQIKSIECLPNMVWIEGENVKVHSKNPLTLTLIWKTSPLTYTWQQIFGEGNLSQEHNLEETAIGNPWQTLYKF